MGQEVRIPRQKRSIKTREQIITTALRIFSQKGFHATSSNEIAAAAEVAVGTFYAYFKDKKHLFLQVMDYYNRLVTGGIASDTVFIGKNLDESLYELIDSILRAHKVHPEFHQEIMSLSLSDKDIRRQLDVQKKKEIDHTMNFIKAGLKEFDASIAIKDIEAASFVIHNTIEKTVHEIIYANTAIPEERIIGELVQMILKYLLCELPPQPSESPAEIKGWL